MASLPDRSACGGIDQSKAQADPPDVVAFLADVFPGVYANDEERVHVERFPDLDGRLLIGLTGHLQTREVEHERIERFFEAWKMSVTFSGETTRSILPVLFRAPDKTS